MPDITVLHGNQRCTHAFVGTPLLHELLRDWIRCPPPCGGKGVCGKCAVMAQGALDPPPAHGRCLACVTRVLGDAEITLPREEELRNIALPMRCRCLRRIRCPAAMA